MTASDSIPATGIVEIPPRLALLVRRALGNAAAGASGVDEAGWRRERDRLEDLLEPMTPSRIADVELRRVIDLLSEATPSEQSRRSVDQWRDEVGEVVAQLSALS